MKRKMQKLVILAALLMAARAATAETELAQGIASFKAGKFDEALPHLEKAKGERQGAFYLGRTYFELRRFDEALSVFKNVVRIDPKNAEAWGELGILYLDRHQLDAALNAFKKSLGIKVSPNSYYEIGRVYEAKGQLMDAITSCEKSIALLDSAQANACLGSTHMNHGEVEAGVGYFERAVVLDGKNPLRHYELGIAYAQVSRMDNARTALEAAVKLKPDYAAARFNLGRVYITQTMYPEALVEMNRAVELGENQAKPFVEKLKAQIAIDSTPVPAPALAPKK